MVSLRALVGLPVIENGRPAGWVEAGYLTYGGDKLLGLTVRSGLRGARWLHADSISSMSGVCVVAQQPPVKLTLPLPPHPGPVWDPSGLRLGRVVDVYLAADTILALGISLGPWDDWRWGRMAARTFTLQQRADGCRVITPFEGLEPLRSFLAKEGNHGPC